MERILNSFTDSEFGNWISDFSFIVDGFARSSYSHRLLASEYWWWQGAWQQENICQRATEFFSLSRRDDDKLLVMKKWGSMVQQLVLTSELLRRTTMISFLWSVPVPFNALALKEVISTLERLEKCSAEMVCSIYCVSVLSCHIDLTQAICSWW